MREVIIGDKIIGRGNASQDSCFIVAEIGINHNGNLDLAREMIKTAAALGVNAVKFQKRTIDLVYSKEELDKYRESPWGTTNREQKEGLEFGKAEYDEIDRYCSSLDIMWFASCWDPISVDFIDKYNPPCYKIASACLTDDDLLQYHRSKRRPIILSTGMSTMEEIEHAVQILGEDNLILLHTTSTYPCITEELNLKMIHTLREKFDVPVGYSGHEVGVNTSLVAAVMGACMIERHFTMDRSMYGSDQAASLEPEGLRRLVRDIRSSNIALGDGIKQVYESEKPILAKLRKKKSPLSVAV